MKPAQPFLALFDTTPAIGASVVLTRPKGPKTQPGALWDWTPVGATGGEPIWRPFSEDRLTKLHTFGVATYVDFDELVLAKIFASSAGFATGAVRDWDAAAVTRVAIHADLRHDICGAALRSNALLAAAHPVSA